MKYQISFSGGIGSAVTALVAYEQGLNFNLIFADTLIEDEDLYRFMDDVCEVVGKKLIYLCDGRTPWEVFEDKRYIGNSRKAPCSQILKTEQVKQWLFRYAAPDDPLVLGMDTSEYERVQRAQKNWNRPVISLLHEYKVYRPQFQEYLDKYNLRKPRLYDLGFAHNNCGGFCVRGGQKQFARLLKTFPNRFEYHEVMEQRILEDIPTTKPFLRKNINNTTHYVPLREFRKNLETGEWKVPEYSEEGCGCFTDV